jgi:hypothetical protein
LQDLRGSSRSSGTTRLASPEVDLRNGMGLEDGRVVDEDVDPTHLARDALDEATRGARVGYVGREGRVRPTLKGGECLLGRLQVCAVVDRRPRRSSRARALSRVLCRARSPSPAPPYPRVPPVPVQLLRQPAPPVRREVPHCRWSRALAAGVSRRRRRRPPPPRGPHPPCLRSPLSRRPPRHRASAGCRRRR